MGHSMDFYENNLFVYGGYTSFEEEVYFPPAYLRFYRDTHITQIHEIETESCKGSLLDSVWIFDLTKFVWIRKLHVTRKTGEWALPLVNHASTIDNKNLRIWIHGGLTYEDRVRFSMNESMFSASPFLFMWDPFGGRP